MESLKVLIVDDELGMRLGVERALSNYETEVRSFNKTVSFETKMAATGSEALELLKENEFDILLLDYKLPDIQGLEILSHVNTNHKDIITIMITAFASLEVAISATKSGAFDFLAKPFTPEDIRNRVAKASDQIYLRRQAEILQKEKKQIRFQFISVLAHELKAPLAAIEGYLNLMDRKISGDSISKYEPMISRSITRLTGMRKMIIDILDLTKLESGNKKREITKLNLTEVAKSSFENVMIDAEKLNITINLDAAEDLTMNADPGELQIIFNNLVTNAVKYNKPDGQVDLKITKDNGKVFITCKDSGIGISKEDQKKLFGEFSRIKNSKTKDIMGSGLGLSILKKITEQYEGTINIESEENVGSTFFVTLKDGTL